MWKIEKSDNLVDFNELTLIKKSGRNHRFFKMQTRDCGKKENRLREKYVRCGRLCWSGNPLVKMFTWNTLNFMQFCFCCCKTCIHVICEETKNSFKITEAGIDISRYRACKYNYFSHVKHTHIVLEICFSISITKDILEFLTISSSLSLLCQIIRQVERGFTSMSLWSYDC